MDSYDCCLKDYFNCNGSGGVGLEGEKRLQTDTVSRDLYEQLSREPDAKYWCHK